MLLFHDKGVRELPWLVISLIKKKGEKKDRWDLLHPCMSTTMDTGKGQEWGLRALRNLKLLKRRNRFSLLSRH